MGTVSGLPISPAEPGTATGVARSCARAPVDLISQGAAASDPAAISPSRMRSRRDRRATRASPLQPLVQMAPQHRVITHLMRFKLVGGAGHAAAFFDDLRPGRCDA